MGLFFEESWEPDFAASDVLTAPAQDIAMQAAQETFRSSELAAEANINGTQNSLPVISDSRQSSLDTPFSGLKNLMGSVGSVVKDITGTARNLGTAVGSIQRDLTGAPNEFERSRKAAESGKLGTWLNRASTTDKLTVGIGIVGIILLLRKG